MARDGTWSGFLTRDPTQLLSIVKQVLYNGLIAVSVRGLPVRKPQPFSGLTYSITHTHTHMTKITTLLKCLKLYEIVQILVCRDGVTPNATINMHVKTQNGTLTSDPTRPGKNR